MLHIRSSEFILSQKVYVFDQHLSIFPIPSSPRDDSSFLFLCSAFWGAVCKIMHHLLLCLFPVLPSMRPSGFFCMVLNDKIVPIFKVLYHSIKCNFFHFLCLFISNRHLCSFPIWAIVNTRNTGTGPYDDSDLFHKSKEEFIFSSANTPSSL